MKRFIYKNKKLRCRIKYIRLHQHYELQLQRCVFLFIWANVYDWLTIKEGYWGEDRTGRVLISHYIHGNISECYPTGKLNIPKRVKQLFKEYAKSLRENSKNASLINQMLPVSARKGRTEW